MNIRLPEDTNLPFVANAVSLPDPPRQDSAWQELFDGLRRKEPVNPRACSYNYEKPQADNGWHFYALALLIWVYSIPVSALLFAVQ